MSVSTPPSHRCPTCRSASVNARNLAVFIDGTSDKHGDKETNVMKLFTAVRDKECPQGLKQRKQYCKGIGTRADVNNLKNKTDEAIAWNVKRNVIDAYKWLAEVYQGDQIYLFGYSRGAYQVRALAAMIHEVGLVKENPTEERCEEVYRLYRSIDPNKLETRNAAIKFKKTFCRPSVRIHFVGVWDTVSSLGLIKKDIHLTSSACVTNACHFRHALALDERRVKFMPEYFTEMNPHHTDVESSRPAVGDVKEVWFAGCHSDVGGKSRPLTEEVPGPPDKPVPVHAGNVPLLWMRREAEVEGLVFESERFAWHPEDVDLGRKDTMKHVWKFVEILPIRHQISFSGTGKHERRWHLFRPRLVTPHQHIHFSVFPGDMYTPRATLGYGVHIPKLPQMASGGQWTTERWTTELATLASLLSDPKETLEYLGEILPLFHRRLDNGQAIPSSRWDETSIHGRTDFDKFSLTVIYDVTSGFSISEELVGDARSSLCTILRSHKNEDIGIIRTLYVLRFSTRHRALRRRFIAHKEVIGALMLALEWTPEGQGENLFPLVMDSLRYLIDSDDDDQRNIVISQLNAGSGGVETGRTRLSSVLEVKAPSHLIASLKMLACLARHQSALCEGLKPGIIGLAKKRSGPVGSAAVEALVALKEPQVTLDIPFANILGYLDNTLPPLDVEVGGTSSPEDTGPPVLQVNGPGKPNQEAMHQLNQEITHKLVQTMESRCIRRRTLATLTFLKLCNNSTILPYFSRNKVLDIFMKQLAQKEKSLLAAYALKTCLKDYKWTTDGFDFPCAGRLIVAMFNKGWLDDAVGQVEGSKIFDDLITFDDLREQVIESGIVTTITKKLEGGECHEVRMSLICLDILVAASPMELKDFVTKSLEYLRNSKRKTQIKGVKILSALAQTPAGEEVIKPHVIDIVKMLLPDGRSSVSRSQLFGSASAVYDLCKNETLRKLILGSDAFETFKRQRDDAALYPQT